MFDSLTDVELQTVLDQFSIPMFVLDRMSPDYPFHIVCMNKALEQLSQRPRAQVVGKSIYDLLPSDEAEEASRNYIRCARLRRDVRFSEVFTSDGARYEWDTTLQSVQTRGGHDRIVGTTQRIERHMPRLSDQFALADNDLVTLRNTQLMAVCRSVQRAMGDVKQTVRQAQARQTPQVILELEAPTTHDNDPFENVSCGTVSAMVARAKPAPQRVN
jgi:PAS domain S-box-containing protein